MIRTFGATFMPLPFWIKTMKKFAKKALIPASLIGLGVLNYQQKLSKSLAISLLGVAVVGTITLPAYAQVNESLIMAYAQSMQASANAQNISQISKLVADDAVISLTREGKGSTTLDKNTYLDLLQKSWTQAKNYRYEIQVSEIIIAGDQARAVITTKESWSDKDGKPHTLTTNARATLGSNGKTAVLLRSVSQVSVK